MKQFRKRRLRRTAKQQLAFGTSAKRRHAHLGGRTGRIMAKRRRQ